MCSHLFEGARYAGLVTVPRLTLSGGQEYDALHKHRGDHMNVKTLITAVIGIAALITTASIRAAEIKILASNGVREALLELAPAFERETGNKLAITFGLAAALKRQIEAGEAFDLPLLTHPGI